MGLKNCDQGVAGSSSRRASSVAADLGRMVGVVIDRPCAPRRARPFSLLATDGSPGKSSQRGSDLGFEVEPGRAPSAAITAARVQPVVSGRARQASAPRAPAPPPRTPPPQVDGPQRSAIWTLQARQPLWRGPMRRRPATARHGGPRYLASRPRHRSPPSPIGAGRTTRSAGAANSCEGREQLQHAMPQRSNDGRARRW